MLSKLRWLGVQKHFNRRLCPILTSEYRHFSQKTSDDNPGNIKYDDTLKQNI